MTKEIYLMAVGVILLSALGMMLVTPGGGNILPSVSSPNSRGPIEIERNMDFTKANGVVSGAGTKADPYIISGWDIDCQTSDYGIFIGNTTRYFVIRDCTIYGADDGNGNLNDPLDRYSTGLTLYNVMHATVEGCYFYENHEADIGVFESDDVVIRENTMRSTIGDYNILMLSTTGSVIENNDIELPNAMNDPVNGTVTKEYGIFLNYDADDAVISGNLIANHTNYGIKACTDHLTVRKNIVRNENYGIKVVGTDAMISDNIVTNSAFSIILEESSNSVIKRNIVTGNSYDGIMVSWDGSGIEGNNTVQDNFISDNERYGIYTSGKDSVYRYNTIMENGKAGMYIRNHGNKIVSNRIEANQRSGIRLAPFSINDHPDRNTIYGNDFVDNLGAPQCFDGGRSNVWSTSTAGNYWSEMTSPDSNRDGIVDTPYIMNATTSAHDKRPVTTPFGISAAEPVIEPRIIEEDVTTVDVNETYEITYSAYDPYLVSGSLVWTIQTNASWLDIDGSKISGIPSKDDIGFYSMKVTVKDGSETDTHLFVLTVIGNAEGPSNGTNDDDTVPDDGIDDNDTDPDNGTNDDDTVPDDGTDENDTVPDDGMDDDSNSTDPSDNDTDPSDDDQKGTDDVNDNGTSDDGDDYGPIWNETTDKAPGSPSIAIPEEEMTTGRIYTLSAYALDPDLSKGDSLSFLWYVDGKYIGSGETLTIVFSEGEHSVKLVVKDRYGKATETSKVILVGSNGLAQKDHFPAILMVIVSLVLVLIVVSIFILKRDRIKDDATVALVDPSDMEIPLMIRGSVALGVVSGPLDRSSKPVLDETRVMRNSEGSPLTPREEGVFRDLESKALRSQRPRFDDRKEGLRELLEKKRKKMSPDVYDDISRILE